MKKLTIIICLTLFSFNVYAINAHAAEDFTTNASIDYSYDESRDETKQSSDEIDDRYDDIRVYYDENNILESEDSTSIPIRNDTIIVFVNDIPVEFDVDPIIVNGRTMVPLRAIFEALGAVVTWNEETSTAKGILDNTTVEITIGENHINKNGISQEIDTPAIIVSGRILVPLRAIAESLDCTVNWYDDIKSVEIIRF